MRPRRAVLTHMDQSLDYRELSTELPDGVEPGQDGLVIELPDPYNIGKSNFPVNSVGTLYMRGGAQSGKQGSVEPRAPG